MNRLLLTAAAALSMAVSSHASAASFVIDSFTDGLYFNAEDGLNLSDSSATPLNGFYSYTGGYDRSATYVSTTPPSYAYFGDEGLAALQVTNDSAANGTLTINYDISSLLGGLGGTGNSALTFTVLGSDGEGRVSITGTINGNSIGSWLSSQSVDFFTPASYQNGAFGFSNSLLTGSGDQLQLVFSGLTGYDVTIGALTIGNVSPVPETSEWAMMLAGLGVVGAVASRRRARAAA